MIVPRASSQTHRCFHYVCIYIPMRVIESELNLNMSLISIRLNCVLCKQNASGTSVVDPRQPRFVLLPTLPGAPGIILKRIRAININIKMQCAMSEPPKFTVGILRSADALRFFECEFYSFFIGTTINLTSFMSRKFT